MIEREKDDIGRDPNKMSVMFGMFNQKTIRTAIGIIKNQYH
jgi:hypothetical protein